MTLLWVIIGILGVTVGILVVYIFSQQKSKKDDINQQAYLMLQNEIREIRQIVDAKLSESTKIIQRQFGESAKIVKEVTESLTRLQETNKQVVNFADQLKNLQDILKNPKQRGILGEYYLEQVLSNVLPPYAYEMQYSFSDGTIVDAVVKINKWLIPVDSKFSLENYNRMLEAQKTTERKYFETAFVNDLKNRIDETAKYVKPEENTMDFAFMFIPSEAIFYDLLVNKVGTVENRDLIEYAFSKRVIIVSPTSFLAYLQTVLQGLRNQKISEEAQKIIKEVEKLGKHLKAYEEYMIKLGKNLETTVSAYNRAYKELGKIDKDVLKISGSTTEIKPLEIESSREAVELEEKIDF